MREATKNRRPYPLQHVDHLVAELRCGAAAVALKAAARAEAAGLCAGPNAAAVEAGRKRTLLRRQRSMRRSEEASGEGRVVAAAAVAAGAAFRGEDRRPGLSYVAAERLEVAAKTLRRINLAR